MSSCSLVIGCWPDAVLEGECGGSGIVADRDADLVTCTQFSIVGRQLQHVAASSIKLGVGCQGRVVGEGNRAWTRDDSSKAWSLCQVQVGSPSSLTLPARVAYSRPSRSAGRRQRRPAAVG